MDGLTVTNREVDQDRPPHRVTPMHTISALTVQKLYVFHTYFILKIDICQEVQSII